MTTGSFRFEILHQHDRTDFDCGVEPLNDYFRNRVGQDVRRHVTMCYVAIDNDTNRLAGYYTLAASGVALQDLPPDVSKRLPRYPMVPAVRIGRLAVDQRFQGRRLGAMLLVDAIERTSRSGIAAFAVIVDAKDQSAVAFYQRQGFKLLANDDKTLFLPISDVLKKRTVG